MTTTKMCQHFVRHCQQANNEQRKRQHTHTHTPKLDNNGIKCEIKIVKCYKAHNREIIHCYCFLPKGNYIKGYAYIC